MQIDLPAEKVPYCVTANESATFICKFQKQELERNGGITTTTATVN
jgi:hypothetical protein